MQVKLLNVRLGNWEVWSGGNIGRLDEPWAYIVDEVLSGEVGRGDGGNL